MFIGNTSSFFVPTRNFCSSLYQVDTPMLLKQKNLKSQIEYFVVDSPGKWTFEIRRSFYAPKLNIMKFLFKFIEFDFTTNSENVEGLRLTAVQSPFKYRTFSQFN